MFFVSKEFVFIFIPILAALSFFVVKSLKNKDLYKYILIFFSIIFYGVWSIKFLTFFLTLILLNYYIINFLIEYKVNKRNLLSLVLILINLSILIYYKYFNFFIANLNFTFNLSYNFKNIILPLGISFIILQQIGFIWTSSTYKKQINLSDFLFFSLFFPQIVAGPILIYEDIKIQISKKFLNINQDNIWKGIQIFFIGFFKKIFIADKLNLWVTSFDDKSLMSIDYFVSVFAYGLQIYFDFSAYSDMAVGLALIFGLSIPVNFLSPYKSKSISEFWQRWHITLTRFLENIIYLPLILNLGRFFKITTLAGSLTVISLTTIITFFLSGFWHGAGWNYIAFGLYHGFFVVLHRLYASTNILNSKNKLMYVFNSIYLKIFATNIIVFLSWVLFRSSDLPSAINFYYSLFDIFDGSWKLIFSEKYISRLTALSFLFSLCIFLPNSYQLTSYRFKEKKYLCSNRVNKLITIFKKYYLDLLIIITIIFYWLRVSLENKSFIYYQF